MKLQPACKLYAALFCVLTANQRGLEMIEACVTSVSMYPPRRLLGLGITDVHYLHEILNPNHSLYCFNLQQRV